MRPGLKRTHLKLEEQIVSPVTSKPQGATCLTCHRLVDEEQLVEGHPGATVTAKVLVRCHGAEELRTFDFGSTNWGGQDLRSFMTRAEWFDPTSHAEAPVGKAAVLSEEELAGS